MNYLIYLFADMLWQGEEVAAAVVTQSVSDGQWHWLVTEVTSSHLSLLLDDSLLTQR